MRRVAVSMSVRSSHADGRVLSEGFPGARSSCPRLRAVSGRGTVVKLTDPSCAVPHGLSMLGGEALPILACPAPLSHHGNGHPAGGPSLTHRSAGGAACVRPPRAAYQRDRLGSRRGSRGLASLTVSARPSSSVPLSPWMAAVAAWLSGISTNPKPLERPVSRSVITLILSTTPYGSQSWRRA